MIAASSLAARPGGPRRPDARRRRTDSDSPLPATIRGVDGATIRLKAPEGGALAVVFLWTDCPISNQYSPTLNAIAEEYAGRTGSGSSASSSTSRRTTDRSPPTPASTPWASPSPGSRRSELPRASGSRPSRRPLVIDDDGPGPLSGPDRRPVLRPLSGSPRDQRRKRQFVGTNDLRGRHRRGPGRRGSRRRRPPRRSAAPCRIFGEPARLSPGAAGRPIREPPGKPRRMAAPSDRG